MQGRADVLRPAPLPDRGGRPRGRPGRVVAVAGPLINSPRRPRRGVAGRRRAEHRVDVSQLVDLGLARSVQLDGRPRVRIESRSRAGSSCWSSPPATGWACSATPPGCWPPHSVQVRSAVLHTVEDVAVNTWRVTSRLCPTCPTRLCWSSSSSGWRTGDRTVLRARPQAGGPGDATGRARGPTWSRSAAPAPPRP